MHLDESIHRLVWEASRNPYLIETLERYFVLSLRVWYVVLDRVPGLGDGRVRSRAACSRRSSTATRSGRAQLMREHVQAFEREIVAAFSRD